ncbi:MAG: FkbM family methyltransferase [Prevotellaceae bacterium]|jgi:FkbM family methyltransferase|nr:FkbM family methyltransferase [Prevotellaceae bacterium]
MNEVYIYGAGAFGRLMHPILSERKVSVLAFIDRAARSGQTLLGLPVLNPNDASISANANVMICITLTPQAYKDLYSELHSLHVGWQISDGQIVVAKRIKFDKFNYAGDWSDPLVNTRKANARNLLRDDYSRTVFDNIISAHRIRDYENYDCSEKSPQYLITNVPNVYSDVIDCGSYIGDTLEQILHYSGTINAYVGFEPEIELFNRLVKTADNNKNKVNQAILFPCAVGNRGEMKHIDGAFGAGTVGNTGTAIQVVKLDDVLPKFAPTFIKMDIEGSEIEAICGAERLIRAYKPALAVCVYHYISDIWEIPLLLHEFNPDYSFNLDTHSTATMETVLYAVDKEAIK